MQPVTQPPVVVTYPHGAIHVVCVDARPACPCCERGRGEGVRPRGGVAVTATAITATVPTVTLDDLKKLRACSDDVAKFKAEFGSYAEITVENVMRAFAAKIDVDWWAIAVFGSDYQAALAPLDRDYQAARASLYRDYQAARASLYRDYQAALAPLDRDYEAALAPLYRDYEAALAPLYRDYQAALAPLDRDYQAALAPLDRDYEAARAPAIIALAAKRVQP